MEECLILSGDPNPKITPSWLNWAFNSVSREKCLREARKAMAIHMVLSSDSAVFIKMRQFHSLKVQTYINFDKKLLEL
jgi:hypothetical protein